MRYNELTFQGRNAVLEAFRSGKTIDKLFILDGCQDGPIKSIVREAKKTDAIINYVDKERLDRLAGTGHHQGVVAIGAAYEYAEVEDILAAAKDARPRAVCTATPAACSSVTPTTWSASSSKNTSATFAPNIRSDRHGTVQA